WPVTDQQVVSKSPGAMGPKLGCVADGRHRYETGLRYLEDRRAAGEVRDGEAAPNFILMMLVGMSDPGLVILPTHRLVSGLGGMDAARFRTLLGPHFELETIGRGDPAARETWEWIEADGSQNVLGLGLREQGDTVWLTGRRRSPQLMDQLAPEHSPAWRELAVSVLHVLVLDRLLRDGAGTNPTCRYVHLLREVLEATAAQACDLAVLVPPARMAHVEQIA